MKIWSVVLVGVALMFTSCTSKIDLAGNWKTVDFEKNGEAQEVCDSQVIFEKGEGDLFIARGNSGVNSFNGEILIDGDTYKASENFASTKMMGDEVSMAFEEAFLSCLINADYYEIQDDLLIIGNKESETFLTFERE